MYEKLDKLREEVRRSERRLADAQNKLKAAQEKLREAEASQILSDVGALKLTPEQLAQVLSLVKSGQLGPGTAVTTDTTDAGAKTIDVGAYGKEDEELDKIDEEIKEDSDDEMY